MSNRVTLDMLDGMTPAEVAGVTTEELHMMQGDLSDLKAKYDDRAKLFAAVMAERYGNYAANMRGAACKDTGTVTGNDGAFAIKADIPKRVEWDQASLGGAVQQLRDMGEDPYEYVTVEYRVDERKFAAWPKSLRSMFEAARTVRPGKQTFKIERKEQGK